jgi:hypothetical protein
VLRTTRFLLSLDISPKTSAGFNLGKFDWLVYCHKLISSAGCFKMLSVAYLPIVA